MMNTILKKICFVYLICVPVLVTALAFIVGHVSFRIYLPIWVLNMLLMALASLCLSTSDDQFPRAIAKCFIFPWMLFTVFGGMGPPPENAAGWASLYLEQILRYTLLILGGISMSIGFIRLKKELANTAGDRYAKGGGILINIALPLFILNMAYWGYFLTYVFKTYTVAGAVAKPVWLKPLEEIFTIVRMLEVALIYLSTATFVVALSLNRQLSKRAAIIYVAIACLATFLNLLPSSINGFLAVASYVSYIPAITMLMPYFIAVNFIVKKQPNIPAQSAP